MASVSCMQASPVGCGLTIVVQPPHQTHPRLVAVLLIVASNGRIARSRPSPFSVADFVAGARARTFRGSILGRPIERFDHGVQDLERIICRAMVEQIVGL